MMFNPLCSTLAFCAAVGGSGASSRRTPTKKLQNASTAPYSVNHRSAITRHRSHKSSRLNAALAGLVDGRTVMGIFVCGKINLS